MTSTELQVCYADKLAACCDAASRPSVMLAQDERVKRIASRLGKTPAQVLLAWGMQRGISVIPKATNPSHQKVSRVAAGSCMDCLISQAMRME